MPVSLCIHGHFYQPPREDPWLGEILAEPSAAPMRNWNERITRESYAPLAWARRLDADGKIADLLNCYEWMSFNAGPTLLRWMQRAFPRVVERMVEGDARSRERWGHGNAMAQIYHHVIMPLATPEDRAIEIRWAIDDFRRYFGREPEGMWLSECAVDLPTLESLADQGIRFVILAPRQAKAVVRDGVAVPVNEGSLNIGEPYRVALSSGKAMTAVFYHGGLSQAIAFEGLLRNGESFWQRIAGEAAHMGSGRPDPALLTLATDGETYGHHFTFGEMALAYVLAQGAAGRDNIRLTNLPTYIAANPPVREALIHEPSSWSCVHGVERWRSDCGCTDGGHHGWNQQWRGPLRASLDIVREAARGHFHAAGQTCFTDPAGALLAYGEVLADPEKAGDFAARWFKGDDAARDTAWNLLTMQEQSLAAYASCAWFFDDIARIEPENAMTFALRALDIMRETGGPDLRGAFEAQLAECRSNQADCGSGKDVFVTDVLPRRDDPATLCLIAWLLLFSRGSAPRPGIPGSHAWPDVSVELIAFNGPEEAVQEGAAVIRASHETLGARYVWRLKPLSALCGQRDSFVPMADAEMTVRPENGPPDLEFRCRTGDLSRPMSDALLSRYLENWENRVRPELLAVAGHAASMTRPWQEAQHDVVRPDFWIGFVPYLVVENMVNAALSPKQRRQLEVVLSLHLTARSKALARNLVQERMLAGLEEGRDDATLSAWAQRVRYVMPDMDWWAVQNLVWEKGRGAYPALARELGFGG